MRKGKREKMKEWLELRKKRITDQLIDPVHVVKEIPCGARRTGNLCFELAVWRARYSTCALHALQFDHR